jgi:hypothetical protein
MESHGKVGNHFRNQWYLYYVPVYAGLCNGLLSNMSMIINSLWPQIECYQVVMERA